MNSRTKSPTYLAQIVPLVINHHTYLDGSGLQSIVHRIAHKNIKEAFHETGIEEERCQMLQPNITFFCLRPLWSPCWSLGGRLRIDSWEWLRICHPSSYPIACLLQRRVIRLISYSLILISLILRQTKNNPTHHSLLSLRSPSTVAWPTRMGGSIVAGDGTDREPFRSCHAGEKKTYFCVVHIPRRHSEMAAQCSPNFILSSTDKCFFHFYLEKFKNMWNKETKNMNLHQKLH